jgi:hypothetical protein
VSPAICGRHFFCAAEWSPQQVVEEHSMLFKGTTIQGE